LKRDKASAAVKRSTDASKRSVCRNPVCASISERRRILSPPPREHYAKCRLWGIFKVEDDLGEQVKQLRNKLDGKDSKTLYYLDLMKKSFSLE